jgi:antitoxin (DNA-binding transcriptional repressor) of toxin-antitoxin stability system
MAELTIVQVRAQLSEVINRAAFAKERLFLTRRGKRIPASVPIDDIDLLEALEDKINIEEARTSLAEAKKKGTLSWDKLKRDLRL